MVARTALAFEAGGVFVVVGTLFQLAASLDWPLKRPVRR
jgi:hypothetical protein